jgi:hypothetical protein
MDPSPASAGSSSTCLTEGSLEHRQMTRKFLAHPLAGSPSLCTSTVNSQAALFLQTCATARD